MNEYRFVTFSQPASKLIPPEPNGVKVLTIDFINSIPELAEHMDGWEPVNFQVLPADGTVFLVFLMKTKAATDIGE